MKDELTFCVGVCMMEKGDEYISFPSVASATGKQELIIHPAENINLVNDLCPVKGVGW